MRAARFPQPGAMRPGNSQHALLRQFPGAHQSAPRRAASCARHGLGTHSRTVCQHSRNSNSIGGPASGLRRGRPTLAAAFSAQPRRPPACAASRQEEPQRQSQQQSLDLPREQDGASPGGRPQNPVALPPMHFGLRTDSRQQPCIHFIYMSYCSSRSEGTMIRV